MKATARGFGLISMALALIATFAPAFAQQNREFTDWAAVCDASLSCMAETHHVGDDPSDFLFRLTRGKDEATWNIVLETVAASPEKPYDIHADLIGASTPFSARVDAAAYGKPHDLHLLGASARVLMAQLGPASEVGFEFYDVNGDLHAARFSLAGLSASLLWIDEKQGRVGSPRQAGNIPEGVEPIDLGVGVPAGIPADVLVLHARHGDCDPFDELPNGADVIVADLGGDRTLYLVPCSSGAYNFAYVAYTGWSDNFERMWFADYSDYSSWTATPYLVNPEWDEAARRLTMLNKGRGFADCGSIGEWQSYDGYLRLEKFYYEGECDGEGGPDDYPLVFEAGARNQ